ncbi:hypothetical protein KSP40_PGU013107 [Platanthera guangdongensis]|uniref:Uncharacterized protein n=1 Tax=Platanthera guangdongensis TaxID=2320717 RepID=A0ABR2LH08_9ASPA
MAPQLSPLFLHRSPAIAPVLLSGRNQLRAAIFRFFDVLLSPLRTPPSASFLDCHPQKVVLLLHRGITLPLLHTRRSFPTTSSASNRDIAPPSSTELLFCRQSIFSTVPRLNSFSSSIPSTELLLQPNSSRLENGKRGREGEIVCSLDK